MSSDPQRPTKVPWVKEMAIGLIAVMSVKALFHGWVVATLNPTNKDYLVVSNAHHAAPGTIYVRGMSEYMLRMYQVRYTRVRTSKSHVI